MSYFSFTVLLFLLLHSGHTQVIVTQKPSWSQMFRGETITLTCEVQGGEGVQWEYQWRTPQSETSWRNNKDWTITASISGEYSCKSRSRDDSYSSTNWSEALRLSVSGELFIVTQKPSWSQIFRGETITLTCEVQGGEGVQWEYQWRTPQSQTSWRNNKDWTITASISGEYSCKSRSRDDSYSSANWSEALRLSVSEPEPVLRVSPRWLSPGSSVTLSCEVEHESAGWSFYWYKAVPDLSHKSVSQGGIYSCRGFRGEPLDVTFSLLIFIFYSYLLKTVSNKVIVTQKPSWSQMFRGETITLTCEVQGGEGVQWEYQWRTPQSERSWRNNKDWTFTASISGEYSCKSRSRDDLYSSTNWSEALRLPFSGMTFIIGQIKHIFSRSGETLTCSVNPSSSGWSYFFYRGEKHDEQLTVQNTDPHLNKEIRVSQNGVYVCRGRRGEPVYYTELSDSVTIDGEFLYWLLK
uniref:Ig-like domain-containing protein n=1 Tax=Oryzias melastigma TaxID=30732 RepID=A0A3B3D971_ORYME